MAEKKHISKLTYNVKKERLSVTYKSLKVAKGGRIFSEEHTHDSDQPLHRSLDNILKALRPHLLYATELAGENIKLDEELDAKKWFNNFEFEEEKLFQGLQVTSVEFIGNEAIDGIRIKGYRETQNTDKPQQVKLDTFPIMFEGLDNPYPLQFIVEEQADDLETCVQNWLKGDTSVEQAPANQHSAKDMVPNGE